MLIRRYFKGKKWEQSLYSKLPEVKIDPEILGEVEKVDISILIDYYTENSSFIGEPGVSYFIKTNDTSILFDTGFNKKKEEPSPLIRNAEKMGIKIPNDVDAVVISHLHLDHVGGMKNQLKKRFSVSKKAVDFNGKTAYSPVKINHPTADIVINNCPTLLNKGILLTDPLPAMLFFMGRTLEQAIVINLKNKGLVVIVGCGHQKIDRLLDYLEKLIPIKVYAIVGGIHFPITESREKILNLQMQKFVGSGKPPWGRITKEELASLIKYLKKREVKKVAISAHDSCDYTLKQFKTNWGNNYIEVKVGKTISL